MKYSFMLQRLITRAQLVWHVITSRTIGRSFEKDGVPALEIHLLSHQNIEPFSLTVEQGEIFGLVGSTDAGKSTIIDLLSGRKTPIDGAIRIKGYDLRHLKQKFATFVGVMPQSDLNTADAGGTAVEHLHFHGRLIGMHERHIAERIPIVLAFVGLSRYDQLKVSAFSLALKQRLALGRALLYDPELLLLDEPTRAIEEQERVVFWKMLCSLRTQGKTILLTTQDWEEVSAVCDRVAHFSQDKLAAVWERASLNETRKSFPKLSTY
jgi:ABC-2 type transport system ATP-binding protein